MLFELTNATAIFQELLHTIYKYVKGCIWLLNNIVIYGANTDAEQQAIIKKVQQQYVNHRLAINLVKSKCNVYENIFQKHVRNG